MPFQNRILPTGEIVADAMRGLFTGNRGILHDENKQLGRARWRHAHWIICNLAYKDLRREIMAPRRWTELFFLDEAVALAAGHRPCALCRRDAYARFATAWTAHFGHVHSAPEIDAVLHSERIERSTRRQKRHVRAYADLPDGSFVWRDGAAWLVLPDALRRYDGSAYLGPIPRPASGEAEVLTPASTLAVLAEGYAPVLHPSATVTPASHPS